MSTSFKEIVLKIVKADVKTILRSSLIVQNLDAHYPRGYRLSHNIFLKVKTQSSNNKSLSYSRKCKTKDSKYAQLRNNTAELAKKKNRKDKKKRLGKHKRE